MARDRVHRWVWILLVAGLAACTPPMPTPAPTPSPTLPPDTPQPTPMPTQTAALPMATLVLWPTATTLPPAQIVSTPTPMPPPTRVAGPLPQLVAELDFSPPVGNAYGPHHLALDEERGLVYVAAERCPGSPTGCIAAVNPFGRQHVQKITSLPGNVYAPFVGAGGRVFLSYTDASFVSHLASFEVESGRLMADLPLGSLSAEVLGLDPAAGHLYVRQGSELQVRSTFDLQLVAATSFPQSGWRVAFQASPETDRIYFATEEAVFGLRADDLTRLWTFQGGSLGKITGLFLDVAANLLYLEAEEGVSVLETTSGHQVKAVFRASEGKAPWDWTLLAADTGAGWLCLRQRQGSQLWLALVSSAAGEMVDKVRLWSAEEAFAWDRVKGLLFGLRRHEHEVDSFRVGPEGITPEEPIPVGIELRSLILDAPNLRVYVTDSHGRVHVIQADEGWQHFQEQANLEGRGLLTLDSEHGRLYVSEDHGPATHVYDTRTLQPIASLDMGGIVALDLAHDLWFLGHEIRSLEDEEQDPTVHVFAWEAGGTPFREIATIPQPGMPVYNPLRGELYLVNDTAYIVEPGSWQVTDVLLPGYEYPDLRRCNGCRIISDLTVLPERNLLLVHTWPISAGKGAGVYPGPQTLDATTHEVITPTLSIQVSICGASPGSAPGAKEDRLILVTDPIQGRTYENHVYSRYVHFRNVWARGGDGRVLNWLDGLEFTLVDPVHRRALAPAYDQYLVVDLETLTPLGSIPKACIRAVDVLRERWFATRDARLLVYSPVGAEPPPFLRPVREAPDRYTDGLFPSPDFTQDQTLFATSQGRLYRSRDGGATWERLRGGLPEAPASGGIHTALAFSPDFGRDATLFVAMYQGDWQGMGVYRSTDGGDTWEPVWHGLQALRIERLAISPGFARDGRVAAYGRYQILGERFEGGEILYLSSNRGDFWTEVGRHPFGVAEASPLPDLATLLPLRTSDLRFRVATNSREVERSLDGGNSWSLAFALLEEEWVQNLLVSSELKADPSAFVFTPRRVLWSPDGGQTWQQATDPRLIPDPTTTWWMATAYVPARAGGPLLLALLGDGTFFKANPWDLGWRPAGQPSQEPTPPPPATEVPPATPAPCAIQPAHFSGLYGRYAPGLGCATGGEHRTWSAWQPFERGAMLWLEETREIWVLEDDGHWQRFADTWTEGQPEIDPNLNPPSGLLQPIRGFGKVWRELLGGPAAAIGWALAPEGGRQTVWQSFEHGWAFEPEGVAPFVVFADGRWAAAAP